MELYEVIFMLSFIGLLAVFVAKFFNVLSEMKFYDLRGVFITFVLNILLWGVGMVVYMLHFESTDLRVLFWLSNGLFLLNWLFQLIEFIGGLGQIVKAQFRGRYEPGKQ